MKSRGGRLNAFVLLWLFTPGRALAQDDGSALPAPPPPPPSPTVEQAPAPAVAPAAVPPPRAPPKSRSGLDDAERNWYGWQLLINDFVALGTLGGAAAAGVRGNTALAVVIPAAIVYDLGSPTIHWLHGRRGIAGASLGVRAGVPFVGVMIGAALAGCANDHSSSANTCRSQGAGYGALAGFAAATALDASLFAFDAPPVEMRGASHIGWRPVVTLRDGGAMVGAAGLF
jgi:hypothetical protein